MDEEMRKAASAFGKLGAKARLKKYGKDYMRQLALKRWAKHQKKLTDTKIETDEKKTTK